MNREKTRSTYLCENCGNDTLKWEGRCPHCNEWNTLVEVKRNSARSRGSKSWLANPTSSPQELSQIENVAESRINLGIEEDNRVLGGGLVNGSLVLLAGDPGIGKSTLLLQLSDKLSQLGNQVLYVSGEESVQQIKIRADRLGINGSNISVVAETDLESIIDHMENMSPALVIIDSIQSVSVNTVDAGPGTISQVRECTLSLLRWSKEKQVAVFLTGHVTKEGNIAGPKSLEHMVDVVLYIEGENLGSYRVLRGEKNRFGSTNEIAVFEMMDTGLSEVLNPSEVALSSRGENLTGSIVVPIIEGTRPLLVEIQALVTRSYLPSPRRVANGVDMGRLLMVIAVLSKRYSFNFSDQDIILNVAGGFKAVEPAADVPMAVALMSSLNNIPVSNGTAAIGEIGLGGELRSVSSLQRRINELDNMGFDKLISPYIKNETIDKSANITIHQCLNIGDVVDALST